MAVLATLLLIASCASAESVSWKGFDIHYTTFSSTLIPAQVAEAHGIVRSRSRIVTNVTVLKANEPTRARVTGQVANLLNQLFTLEFTEVVEAGAIYYLADLVVDERDTLRYAIDISPLAAGDTYRLEFTRDYFAQ